MKHLIIYHRADYDGVFSMMVTDMALQSVLQAGDEVNYLGWNYGDKVPAIRDLAAEYGSIFLVDLSFPPETMLTLRSIQKEMGIEVTWIDHHITSIQSSIDHNYSDLAGFRAVGRAAVEYCWEYFFPDTPMPRVIQLAGAYDVWNQQRFPWEDVTLAFQYGMKGKYFLSTDAIMADRDLLLNDNGYLDQIIESGRVVLGYLKRSWASSVKRHAFDVTVAGKYKGIACISTEFSSNLFGAKGLEYDVMVVLNWNPSEKKFNVSMYIDPSRETDFNCGAYMKEFYNGGGHQRAAGGTLTKEEFEMVLVDNII